MLAIIAEWNSLARSGLCISMHVESASPASYWIEGPDEHGHLWAYTREGRDVWYDDLGPVELVAEMMPECFHLMHGAETW